MKLSGVHIFGEWARNSFKIRSPILKLYSCTRIWKIHSIQSPRGQIRLPQKILSSMMNESTTFRYSFSLSLRPWSVMSKDFVLILCFTSLRVSVTVVVLLPRQVKYSLFSLSDQTLVWDEDKNSTAMPLLCCVLTVLSYCVRLCLVCVNTTGQVETLEFTGLWSVIV